MTGLNTRLVRVAIVCGLAAATGCGPARLAESPGAFKPATARTQLDAAEATKLVLEFDNGAEEVYRLGQGDEITVDVWDRPEVTGRHVIGPDGQITLPFVGSVKVADQSREEAAEAIRLALTHYVSKPIVTARVERYTAQRVFILGRVTNPGAILFEGQPTLLETIVRAGGLPVGGVGAERAALARCAIFRGRDRVLWVDLKSLLNGSNLSLNIRLKRNDTVYLPDSDDQLVYALGELKRPGAFRLTPNMSLMDVIALAGGPTEDADSSKVLIVRPDASTRREVSLEELIDPRLHLNIALEEGDVVYVPRRGFAKFGYMMSRISPLTGLLVLGKAMVP